MLGVKCTMPQRFLSHRWLSSLDLTEDTLRLFDCYTLLYYQFLPTPDKTTYHAILVNILAKNEITAEARQEILRLRNELGKIQMTAEGKRRKQGIIKQLFHHRDDTLMLLKFFSSALPLLKEF